MTRKDGIAEALHEEHLRTLEVMNALEERITGPAKTRPIAIDDDSDQALLEVVLSVLDLDISRHFRFEEEVLFPVLEQMHIGDVTQALVHEHEALRPLAQAMEEIATRARRETLDDQSWTDFRYAAMDLIHSVLFHIQKEEMTVIRRLGILLAPDTDESLCRHYVEFRA